MSGLLPVPVWKNDTSCCRLHVGGLANDVSPEDLVSRFSKIKGINIESVDIIADVVTGRPKGFAYVMVTGDVDSPPIQQLIKVYHRTRWRGRQLKVQPAKEHYLVKLHREAREALLPRIERQRLERRRRLGLKDGDPDPTRATGSDVDDDDDDPLFGSGGAAAAATAAAVAGGRQAKSTANGSGVVNPVDDDAAEMPDWLMDSSDEDVVGKSSGGRALAAASDDDDTDESDGTDDEDDDDDEDGDDGDGSGASGSGSASDDGNSDDGNSDDDTQAPSARQPTRLTFGDDGLPVEPTEPELKTLFGGEDNSDDDDDDDARFNPFPDVDPEKADRLMAAQAKVAAGGDSRFRIDASFLNPDDEPAEQADDADAGTPLPEEDAEIRKEIEDDQERGLAILDNMFGSRPPPPPAPPAPPVPVIPSKSVAAPGQRRRGFVSMNRTRRYDPLRDDAAAFELPMEPKKTKKKAGAKARNGDDDDDDDDDDDETFKKRKAAPTTPAPDLTGAPKVAQLGVSSWQQMMTEASTSGTQGFTLLGSDGGGAAAAAAAAAAPVAAAPAPAASGASFAFNFAAPPAPAPAPGSSSEAPFAFNFNPPADSIPLKPVRDLGVRFGGGGGDDDGDAGAKKSAKGKGKDKSKSTTGNKSAAKPGSAALRFFAAPDAGAGGGDEDGDGEDGDGADDWQSRRLRLKRDYKRKLREMKSGRGDRRRRKW